MAFCRDWKSTLRRASYRGVPFFVELDSYEVGRRLVIHEAANRDEPFVEDLGAKAVTINVTAYICEDEIEAATADLIDACAVGGPAALELPMDRFQAHCQSCKRTRRKDQMGHMAFDLQFVRQGTTVGPISTLGLARAVEYGAVSMVANLIPAFQSTFATLGFAPYVLSEATGYMSGFFADFAAAARTFPVASSNMAKVLRTVGDSLANIDELCAVGAVGDRWTGSAFADTAQEESGEDLVQAVAGVFEQVALGLPNDDNSTRFQAEFIDWGTTAPASTGNGSGQIIANSIAVNNLVRSIALARFAAAVTNRNYTDRREARQAKADAAEFFNNQMDQIAGWENFAVWKQLVTIQGQVVEHLHRVITDLAPIAAVSAPNRMPALWWAQRLYGDYRRADELVQRNGVKHGGFMPSEFEAAQR